MVVAPILPALRTRARAPFRGARPDSPRNRGLARLRRGLFYWVQRDKKENNKAPPPHLYLGVVHPTPLFKKK